MHAWAIDGAVAAVCQFFCQEAGHRPPFIYLRWLRIKVAVFIVAVFSPAIIAHVEGIAFIVLLLAEAGVPFPAILTVWLVEMLDVVICERSVMAIITG